MKWRFTFDLVMMTKHPSFIVGIEVMARLKVLFTFIK